MARIKPVTNPQGKTLELLNGVKQTLGSTPNVFTTMGNSPAVLDAFLKFSQSLNATSISGKLREQIALAIAGQNSCQYCASAHTLLGKKAGVPELELTLNLEGSSKDPKTNAAIKFAKAVSAKRGKVSNEELKEIRNAGYSDGEIAEIVATVVLNIFTNYFNLVAETDVDFPVIQLPNNANLAKV